MSNNIYSAYLHSNGIYLINSTDISSNCIFETHDLWSKNIFKWIKPNKKYNNCKNTIENNYYNLKNGILSLHQKIPNDTKCTYKCYYPINDKKMREGSVNNLIEPVNLDCDTLEINCKNKKNKTTFVDLGFHINNFPKLEKKNFNFLNSKYKMKKNIKKFNVFIYVVDSLSYYQALRGLNYTRKILLNDFQGIEMKYLNIQGENSRPNAYGLLMNKQRDDIYDSYGVRPVIKNDFFPKESCNTPLDNNTYIVDYYRQMGYLTMNAEDFFDSGVFNYYNCIGFTENPYHHSLRPFQILKTKKRNEFKQLEKEKCYSDGLFLLDYFDQFLEKNTSMPKLSLVWHSFLMHDDINRIFSADEIFQNFFKKNAKQINNSFTILMGDHGFRLSDYQKTDIGFYEHKNPYFIMTVPYELRSNKHLINNLKTNSEKHISHLDIYATLLDILTEATNNNFTNLQPYDLSNVVNEKIKGKSLIRPLEHRSRDCYEMYIPIQYCLCHVDFKYLELKNKKEYEMLEKTFIKELNNKIVIGNLTNICAKMVLDKEEKFIVKKATDGTRGALYQIEATTSPGKATYRATFNDKMVLIGNEITRTNSYNKQAEVCEKKSEYRKFCYCKSLLKKP
uniref:Sulfatase domain-containing protein n=1 Tax=Strongyloides papillosus TaxID=174720 RepID=A0A0N5BLE4_STREA